MEVVGAMFFEDNQLIFLLLCRNLQKVNRTPVISLENHAQYADFRSRVSGSDLISRHGFGQGIPQGGRSGGPGWIVPSDLVSDEIMTVESM